jgi:AraC-like DNA-binding protein
VAEGTGRLELNGRHYELRPGAAFAYAPDVPHRISNNAQAPMLKYYLDFTGNDALELLSGGLLGKWELAQVSAPGEISELFDALGRNGANPTPFTPAICSHLVPLLLLKISELAVPIGAPESRAFPTYQRARRRIEERFLELQTAEQIAGECHVNVSYLCRLFQRFARKTPYQFLLRLKMERAATLLLEFGMPVKEAAAKLGFSDPFHFSRSFKRRYGLSPAAFVQQGRRLSR